MTRYGTFFMAASLSIFAMVFSNDAFAQDRERCDCLDNDGDGLVDEGLKCEYEVSMDITADDAYEAFINGSSWGSDSDWRDIETYGTALTAGTHHIGVYAEDVSGSVSGFLSSVTVNGTLEHLSGAGSDWLASDTFPGSGWETSTAGLATTVDASACTGSWGTFWPSALLSQGAEWVWTEDCSDPASFGENWYVLEFEVCPEALEICNCEDDDGDGLVDEGLECEYEVSMDITADDAYEAYIDGAAWGSDNDWRDIETYGTALTAGTHHIGVYAWDVSGSVSGFLSSVTVNGSLEHLSGSASDWRGSSTFPGSGWETSTAGLSSTIDASACSATWGTYWPAGLLSQGADWVWTRDCTDPATFGENWYVLEFEVCPEAR